MDSKNKTLMVKRYVIDVNLQKTMEAERITKDGKYCCIIGRVIMYGTLHLERLGVRKKKILKNQDKESFIRGLKKIQKEQVKESTDVSFNKQSHIETIYYAKEKQKRRK